MNFLRRNSGNKSNSSKKDESSCLLPPALYKNKKGGHITSVHDLMTHLRKCNRNGKILIIRAGASWCQPSRLIETELGEIARSAEENFGSCVEFLHFNISEVPLLTKYFGVKEIPYFACLLPHKNVPLRANDLRFVGSDPDALKTWVDDILSKWRTFGTRAKSVKRDYYSPKIKSHVLGMDLEPSKSSNAGSLHCRGVSRFEDKTSDVEAVAPARVS